MAILRAMSLPEGIASRIKVIRQHRVILAADLAELYGVPVRRLNEQVRRNADRFPVDFAFQLTAEEWISLKSQFATSKGAAGLTRPVSRAGRDATVSRPRLRPPHGGRR